MAVANKSPLSLLNIKTQFAHIEQLKGKISNNTQAENGQTFAPARASLHAAIIRAETIKDQNILEQKCQLAIDIFLYEDLQSLYLPGLQQYLEDQTAPHAVETKIEDISLWLPSAIEAMS
ncbi:hypothetical protein BT96DRAFT_945703 [Gymnopus androsaceus JB14]|uniref:Uncharacterized protein n=1 Tax=Gymnopus androsaceus JB14 TaxID=1447944 RepID=A0A6A4GYN2_9AGAR|nr:hypothetical protein BT96DRAFT_945703 [Gymnopus androsaceus JB14]